MKKLFGILLVTALTSCGNENTIAQSPKSNTDYKNIIGKPIKMGNLEIAQNDFPNEMNWPDAKTACKALGDGWRLPTKSELRTLYATFVFNKSDTKIFLVGLNYWSSASVNVGATAKSVGAEDNYNGAWLQDFSNGKNYKYHKSGRYDVRAVRGFELPEEPEKLEEPNVQADVPASVIGKPISLQKFVVAQYDFPKKMSWGDAKVVCARLGKGWRLPTKNELNVMYRYKNKFYRSFATTTYWSSTEENSSFVWYQSFGGGGGTYYTGPNSLLLVRAVRDFELPEVPKVFEEPGVPASVIGKPISLQKFVVAQYDFIEEMSWGDAKAACAKLGEGWRLPTKNELNLLYQNKDKIGGFANFIFWSSTEYDDRNAWGQDFRDGLQSVSNQGDYSESAKYNVRAVRDF